MTRHRALRALHYITEDGEDRTVQAGDFVTNASVGKIAALLADGFIEAAQTAKPEKAPRKDGA